jgi:hypothetical protein
MKKITLSLLAVSVALLASPGHTHHGGGTTMATFVNDVIDNTNQIKFANSGATWGTTGTLVIDEDINILDVALRYNPTANWGLDARIPIVNNDITDETGIGDFSISGNYHFGTPDSEYGTNITTLRYKNASGDVDKGLGTDEDSYTLSHTVAKAFPNGFSFHGLATYTLNSGDIEDSFALMAGTSHQCLLTDKAVTNAKITYFHQDDFSATDLWIEWSNTNVLKGVPLAGGIKIPLQDDFDKTFLFYLSASGFFE